MSMYGSPAHTPVECLQALVAAHPVGLDGQCVSCQIESCELRSAAQHRLRVGHILPRHTRPESIGADRSSLGGVAGRAGRTARVIECQRPAIG